MRPRRTPHVIVTSLRELVENVRALPHGELTPRRIDGDGDAVVVARFGLTTETFWVKAALLEQLAPLTDALPETMRLIQALGRLRAGAGD